MSAHWHARNTTPRKNTFLIRKVFFSVPLFSLGSRRKRSPIILLLLFIQWVRRFLFLSVFPYLLMPISYSSRGKASSSCSRPPRDARVSVFVQLNCRQDGYSSTDQRVRTYPTGSLSMVTTGFGPVLTVHGKGHTTMSCPSTRAMVPTVSSNPWPIQSPLNILPMRS